MRHVERRVRRSVAAALGGALVLWAAPLAAQAEADGGSTGLAQRATIGARAAEGPEGRSVGERPCGASGQVCALWSAGLLPADLRAGSEVAPRSADAGPLPAFQERDRRGVPLIVAGGALLLGGAIVGDDAGTLLMVGGVLVASWGLYVYF